MNRYGLAAAVTAGLAIGGGYLVSSAQYVPPNSSGNGRIVAQLSLTGEQLYTTTGTSSDIALSASASVFRYQGAGIATFTGFAASTAGRTVIGRNESSSNVTLPHNATSTAANRLSLPTSVDWTCLPGGSWTQMYVAGSTNRWLVFPGSACFSSTHPATSVACATGESQVYDTTLAVWQCRLNIGNDYRSTHQEYSHDFINTTTTDWLGTGTSGAGATAVGAGSTTTRPGIAVLQTGTTTTGLARWNGGSAIMFDLNSYSSLMFEIVGGWPILSTAGEEYADVIGFGDTVSAVNQVNGCFFLEDRLPVATAPGTGTVTAGSTNLQCRCCSGSTCTGYTMDGAITSQEGFTTVATPIAALTLPSTNIYRMRVVITGTTRAEFYVDSGSGLTKRCDINTNLPTASRIDHVFNIVKSAGTTSRDFDVDWAHLALDQTTARTP